MMLIVIKEHVNQCNGEAHKRVLKSFLDNKEDLWHRGVDISDCGCTGNTFGLFLGFGDKKKNL